MRLWYEVALSDAMSIEWGDLEELYLREGCPSPKLPFEEFHQLIMEWSKFGFDMQRFTPDQQTYLDWFEEQQQARNPLSTAPRSDKMLIYRVAAALFNNQLLEDQNRGDRLSEKPTTPGALQRALHRDNAKKRLLSNTG